MARHKRTSVVLAAFASTFGVAFGDVLYPTGNVAVDTAAIQDAIDTAANASGGDAVTLGEGTFEINAQLMVTGGVVLVGQSWMNTVIRQTVSDRVVTLDGGSKLERVTLTGGKLSGSWKSGAGAVVKDGTISWCCISNNTVTGYNIYGGGIRIYKGGIDHSIIANNQAGVTGDGYGGGLAYYFGDIADRMGPVTVDTCLFFGNAATGSGGAVFDGKSFPHDDMLAIYNTTITGNSATGSGGGIFGARAQLTLGNCILADNTAADGANYSIGSGVSDTVAEQTRNCFFGNGSTAFGSGSVSAQQAGFKDAANGDYRLKASSWAADVGAWYNDIPADLDGSTRKDPKTAAGCYECFEVDPGVVRLNPVVVTPGTSTAKLAGSIASLGEGTSATVTLTYGLSADALTESMCLYGIVTDFEFDVTELTHATHYFFAVTAENDEHRSATATGDFFSKYDSMMVLLPSNDPSDNVAKLSAAFSSAAATQGKVSLGEGLFVIDAELTLDGGITVVGQGWDKTIIRQTAAKKRVATLDGGAKLVGVTVTGGNVDASWAGTAGVQINDGTVSWCRVTDNKATGRNCYGGGVSISKGAVDHSIIDHNQGGDYSGGGGVGVLEPSGETLVDNCLIYGNTAPNGAGGGVYASFGGAHKLLTVRNTTIANNTSGEAGGGVSVTQNIGKPDYDFALINSILADNTAGSGDANLELPTNDPRLPVGYAAQSFGNVFANGTAALGEDSKSVAGSGAAWFKDAANGNYHVESNSPVVGVGRWYEDIAVDLDGKARTKKVIAGCYKLSVGFFVSVR